MINSNAKLKVHFPCRQRKQQGAALMVLLVIMVMGAVTFLVNSLSRAGPGIGRAKTTSDALAQAKGALIAYALADQNRPGELPCPDIDNDGQLTMNVDYIGSQCAAMLGRLPWKTLGLPDLRDGAGERLWYALSDPFHANSTAVLNSDTAGAITVRNSAGNILNNGCAAYGLPDCPDPGALDAAFGTGAVAVIIAPGDSLARQDNVRQTRGCAVGIDCDGAGKCTSATPAATPRCNPVNYLDIATVGGHTEDNANFSGGSSSNGLIQGAIKTHNPATKTHDLILNDQLMPITHDNLFAPVEKVVGKRAANMLNAHLSGYWGTSFYPFAAAFTDPSASLYAPSFGINHGLLPSTAVWAGIPAYALTGGSASVACSLRNGNNAQANARARCDISGVSGAPAITISGALNYLGLWRKHDLARSNEVQVRYSGSNVSAAAVPGMNAAIVYTVNADSSVTLTFSGKIVSGVTRIELRDVVVDAAHDWFTGNKWQQVMHYAVAPGYAPGGGNACNPLPGTPPCLTLNGNGGGDDKRAVLVMAGRALAGQRRPPSPSPPITLDDYLEGANKTPANFIYENQGRASHFNDQVMVVAP